MLLAHYSTQRPEAGCDEAGRGCLAGSVYAAAVVLPEGYANAQLNDSKQLSPARRYRLREEILRDAVAWAVGTVSASEIDEINILNASILAMHRALDGLKVRPAFRGNAFCHDCERRCQIFVHRGRKYFGQNLSRRRDAPFARAVSLVWLGS